MLRGWGALVLGVAAFAAVGARGGVVGARGGVVGARGFSRAAPLAQELDAIAGRVHGVVGYAVLDLTSGAQIGRRQSDVFPTASTIKLAILYELFRRSDEGAVRLEERLTLDRAKAVGGSGVLFQLGTPTLSLRDYATLMVIVSDNTAANVLIDRLGLDRVSRRMDALGLHQTRLRRRTMDVAARRRGDENVSTPRELVRLLQILCAGDGLSPAARDEAMAMLKKPKTSRLRAGVPAGVPVADKPGELEGIRVDAGIVFAEDRPYALAVMARSLQSEADGERAIEEMSRAAYAFFTAPGRRDDRGRARTVNFRTGYGDASACLK